MLKFTVLGLLKPLLSKLHDNFDGTASPTQICLKEALTNDSMGNYGGFPIKFLLLITRLSQLLDRKKKHILKLSELNTMAERRKSFKENWGKR